MEKNMQINFDLLEERVLDTLEISDLEYIRYELSNINKPTIVSGVGGSSVVSEMMMRILDRKNYITTLNVEPRDFNYRGIRDFDNVIACSYGGFNFGVDTAFNNSLKKYLLSSRENTEVTSLQYKSSFDKEKSFISLGATLMPISVIMNYYLDGDDSIIKDIINPKTINNIECLDLIEIFSGYDTSVAAKYLESTIVEAGIGIPVVHDKYSYCHGRSTMMKNYDSTVIYLDSERELDEVLIDEISEFRDNNNKIVLEASSFIDPIVKDFDMLVQSMYLTKMMAENQNKDLSGVDYSPMTRKIYKFNSQM